MKMAIVSCFTNNKSLYRYQMYLLKEIRTVAGHVLMVCNSDIDQETKKWCCQHDIKYLISEKKNDVAMWKEIVLSKQFQEIKKNISELILMNDSFFGPVYSWNVVFDEMGKRTVDFWGISVHQAMKLYGAMWPRFLQRYFMVFRSKIIQEESWDRFWKTLPEFNDFTETEKRFEFVLTRFFENAGYKWASFCETGEWETEDTERAMSFLIFRAFEMLEKKKLPIVSKQIFLNSKEINLCYNYGNESTKILDFLQKKTKYDVSMIFEFLIKNLNPYELWSNLNCTYILPDGRNYINSINENKVVIVAHLFYEDLMEHMFTYLKRVPEWMDIIITTDGDLKVEKLIQLSEKNLLKRCKIIKVKNKGREWSSLLMNIKRELVNYKYFCFIHDKKSSQMFYPTVGITFNEYIWDTILPSEEQIQRIIDIFEENNYIGMLAPPVVYHGEFWGHSSDFWTINFDGTLELAKKMKLHMLPSKEYPLLTVGSCFWGRTAAFRALFSFPFSYEDFEAEPMKIDGTINHFLERILTFVVQNEGYYSALIMSQEYAQYDITNFRTMISKMLKCYQTSTDIDITSPMSTIQSLCDRKKGLRKIFRREK